MRQGEHSACTLGTMTVWRISDHYIDRFGKMDNADFRAMIEWLKAQGTLPRIGEEAEVINARLVLAWSQYRRTCPQGTVASDSRQKPSH